MPETVPAENTVSHSPLPPTDVRVRVLRRKSKAGGAGKGGAKSKTGDKRRLRSWPWSKPLPGERGCGGRGVWPSGGNAHCRGLGSGCHPRSTEKGPDPPPELPRPHPLATALNQCPFARRPAGCQAAMGSWMPWVKVCASRSGKPPDGGDQVPVLACCPWRGAQGRAQGRHSRHAGGMDGTCKELRVLRRFLGTRGPDAFQGKQQMLQPIPKGSHLPKCQARGAARGS